MKKETIPVLILCLVAAIAIWYSQSPSKNPVPAPVGPIAEPPASSENAPANPMPPEPTVASESILPAGLPVKPRPPAIPVPMEEVRTELEDLQVTFRDFRTVLGENPVGTNAEITHTLIGNNLKQVRATIPPGSSINADGELCDRWKTPYFFHQLSAKDMEIHSAGPDRIMGTGDDVVVK